MGNSSCLDWSNSSSFDSLRACVSFKLMEGTMLMREGWMGILLDGDEEMEGSVEADDDAVVGDGEMEESAE